MAKKKAKKEEFIKNYKKSKKDGYPKSAKGIGCGTGLAGKICRRNNAKLNKTEFVKKFKKSYNYQDTQKELSRTDHFTAEASAYAPLVNYIKASMEGEISKIPFEKGLLTLSRRERGLYQGFFQDRDGQLIERFDDSTIEMVAKTMEVKELYDRPKEKTPEPTSQEPASIRIKYGDLELEIRKSLHKFINDFKKSKTTSNSTRKLLKSWVRNYKKRFSNDFEAAQTAVKEWDEHKEAINQTAYALKKMEDEQDK